MPGTPFLFSTMTCWPHTAVSFSAINLATISVACPGGNGTISLTGFSGNTACALVVNASIEQQSAMVKVVSALNVVCRNIIWFQLINIAWLKVINCEGVQLINFVKLNARSVVYAVKRRSTGQPALHDDKLITYSVALMFACVAAVFHFFISAYTNSLQGPAPRGSGTIPLSIMFFCMSGSAKIRATSALIF